MSETRATLTTEALWAMIPYAAKLGIEILSAGPAEVRGRLPWKADLCTVDENLHGGALMSLGDSLGATCALLNLPPNTTTVTLESKTNLFRAGRKPYVEAVSRPLHVGRTTIVVQTDISDAAGKRVAQVTQTQIVLPRQI